MPNFDQSPLGQPNITLAQPVMDWTTSNLAVVPDYAKAPPLRLLDQTNIAISLSLVEAVPLRARPVNGRRWPLRVPEPVFPPPDRRWPIERRLASTASAQGRLMPFLFVEPPPVADPDFASVSLLLSLNGPEGGTSFPDTSSNALAITRNSTAALSTAQARFGGASLRINGGTEYLNTPATALLSFPGDFTVEGWVRLDAAASGLQTFIEIGTFGNGVLIRPSGNSGDVWVNGNNLGNIQAFFTTATWHFIHLSRSGTAVTCAVDGTTRLTGTVSGTINSTNAAARIGYPRHTSGQQLFGWVDDVRVTKGVARSTARPRGSFQAY